MRGPKFRAFFFPSPTTNFVFLSLSLCVFSLNFGGVWKRRDPQMCTFGLSGCRVKPRRLWGRRRAPALQTPPKFNEKTSKRGREEEKKAKFWAVRRSCPAEGGPASLSPVEGGSSGGLWGSGFGVQGSCFWGQKQKQNKKKMKSKMRKKKVKKLFFLKKKTRRRKKRNKKRRNRANTICSTSANFDFGQFDFGQLAEVELSEVELAEVEHPRHTPRSKWIGQ